MGVVCVDYHRNVDVSECPLERPQGDNVEPQGAFVEPQGALVEPQGDLVKPQGALVELQNSVARPLLWFYKVSCIHSEWQFVI